MGIYMSLIIQSTFRNENKPAVNYLTTSLDLNRKKRTGFTPARFHI